MNTETVNLVNQMLAGIITNAAATKDFLLAQTPDVLQQLLVWKATISGLNFVIAICIPVIIFLATKRVIKYVDRMKQQNSYFDESVPHGILFFFSVIASAISIFLINLVWLQILIAPKVYLIEYAAKLVGK